MIDLKEIYIERGFVAIKVHGRYDLNGYNLGWVAKFANPQSMGYALCYAAGKLGKALESD